MTRLRILSTTFKITWHASIFHQEATVRSYLKKYSPSASVMSPKVQRNHRKTEETSVTEARTLSKVLPENHSWNISAEFIRHILFTRGRLRRFWFWTLSLEKAETDWGRESTVGERRGYTYVYKFGNFVWCINWHRSAASTKREL